MALSIRNPEVETLARNLAARTGQSMTDEILQALRERETLLTEQSGSRLARIQELSRRAGALPILDPRSPEEILGYTKTGGF